MFLLLLGIVSAGTVTISVTCPSHVVNNSATFTIRNLGNESAYQLIIVPHFLGIPTNYTQSLQTLYPGINETVSVPINQTSANGTVGAYLDIAYQQESSQFSSVFPCLVSFGNATSPGIIVESNVSRPSDGNGVVSTRFINLLDMNITLSSWLVLPPTFTYSNGARSVPLQQMGKATESENVSYPVSNSNFTGAVLATYMVGNRSYTSLSKFSINTSPLQVQKSGVPSIPILPIAVVVAVAVVVLLIIRASLKKKRRS